MEYLRVLLDLYAVHGHVFKLLDGAYSVPSVVSYLLDLHSKSLLKSHDEAFYLTIVNDLVSTVYAVSLFNH